MPAEHEGAFFLAEDLPDDPDERDPLLLRIMGTPDPRQVDGIGGAHPLTSKAAVKHAIAAIDSGGTTDLSSGYLRGLQEAQRVAGPTGATLILVAVGERLGGRYEEAGGLFARAWTKARQRLLPGVAVDAGELDRRAVGDLADAAVGGGCRPGAGCRRARGR